MREPEAVIEDEEPKRAEKIIRHTEMKAYTIEFEYEYSDDEDWFEELNELIVEKNVEEDSGKIEKEVDLTELETVSPINVEIEEEGSKDEELFNELFELIMKDDTEEFVGDIDPEVQEFSLDKLETVSPMDEDVISPRFNKSGKTTDIKIEPQISSEKTTTAPREDKGVRRSFNTEDLTAPHSTEVRRSFEFQGFSDGKGSIEVEIENDDNPKQKEVGLNGLETVSPMNVKVEFNLDNELQESIGEVEGEEVELLDINVNNIKSENLEEREDEKEDVEGMTKEEFGKWLDNGLDGLETISPMEANLDFDFDKDMKFFEDLDRENLVKNGLKCLETVFPNKVIKDVLVNEVIEERDKPPDRDELYSQGIINFIDKFVAWLLCRKDESFGKVRVASSYARFHKKKCKNICIYFGYLRTLDIFVGTKEWNDAMVKIFEEVFVSNETCTFEDDYFGWRT